MTQTSTVSGGANHPGLPIVAMAATSDGGGYWLADTDGKMFRFGDAAHLKADSLLPAKSPVVGIAVTPERNRSLACRAKRHRPQLR